VVHPERMMLQAVKQESSPGMNEPGPAGPGSTHLGMGTAQAG
jgi:hypothetical protein